MKPPGRILLIAVCGLLSLFAFLSVFTYTIPIGKEKSVAYSDKVVLGGMEQWILIRGQSENNPLLLYLHGGPGDSESLLFRHYQKDLEKYFICVAWDQRGAGKSYSENIPDDTLTLNQLISDANSLVKYLKKKFNKDRIYLMGHSFGSVIGINVVYKYPEDYKAYIGIGQMVDSNRQETIAYDYTLSQAVLRNNEEALRELKSIGRPDGGRYKYPLDLLIQRKWLTNFNGVRVNNNDFLTYKIIVGFSPEYNISDKFNMLFINVKTFSKMIADFTSVNVTGMTAFKVPIYLCSGKYDYNTPASLVVDYFNKIKAPEKELKIFEKSAHAPNFEQSKMFNDYIIRKVLSGE